jgi:peptidoglycan/LPS O-acetylase OafA/YrhL
MTALLARPDSPHVDQRPPVAIPGPGTHLPALDGLRGLAVLMVVVFHVFQVEPAPTATLPRVLYLATRIGQTGVDLFFVLSGFLITGILFDTKHAQHYFRNFYGRRTLRIFPLYYGVLVMGLIVIPRILGTGPAALGIHPLWLWTYTTNLPMALGAETTWFGHFWTLAIEEQFYLVWPAVVLAFERRTLMHVCAGCVVAAALFRLIAESAGISSFSFTFCRMDSLTLGAWLALAARGPRGVRGWQTPARVVFLASVVLLAPLYVVASGSGAPWLQVIKFSAVAVGFGALLSLAITAERRSWTGRLFHARPLRGLGRYSYGLYVYHPFLISLAAAQFSTDRLVAHGWSAAAALWLRVGSVLLLSFAAAWLSWQLYERPVLSLKKYFEYRPKVRGLPEQGSRRPRIVLGNLPSHVD